MNYGDIVLGVECGLPREPKFARRLGHGSRFMKWFLVTFLRRT